MEIGGEVKLLELTSPVRNSKTGPFSAFPKGRPNDQTLSFPAIVMSNTKPKFVMLGKTYVGKSSIGTK